MNVFHNKYMHAYKHKYTKAHIHPLTFISVSLSVCPVLLIDLPTLPLPCFSV